ncbi:trypsin-like peptidase domain-containing protein [Micromonospora sp. NPDC048830]|uniref:S1C family serine protease n=1 Tax=Micromonospora sp. NPDC048830 TaxID=3364257 RepID=UPI0037170D7D
MEPPRGAAAPYPPPAIPGQAAVPAQAAVPGQWGGGSPPAGWPAPGQRPAAPVAPVAPPVAGPPHPQPAPGASAYPQASPAAAAFPQQAAPVGPAFPQVSPGGPSAPQVSPGGPSIPQAPPVVGPAHPHTPGATGAAYPQAGASPVPGPAWPAQAAGTPAPGTPARGRALTLVALGLAVVLAVAAGVQAYQINRLSDRLADTNQRLTAMQDGDNTRFDGLDQRTQALEKQAGAQFNPEAVASAVLPSVFRVRAGQFTGTAFAVGKPPAGGGANLFTNFHVVESVWNGGGREVFLERTDQRFPATIVKVDEENDIAHLRTTGRFTGLVTASTPVKSGQQIVVVGAPLGLEDSVTTGVVSAFRDADAGSGPVIQFDAPINPGNSGGPVINGQKQVVGIATAKARDAEGIGLAVPIKVACDGFRIC